MKGLIMLFKVLGLPQGHTLETSSLEIAIDSVQAHVLIDDYFDDLSTKDFMHAALEWVIEL